MSVPIHMWHSYSSNKTFPPGVYLNMASPRFDKEVMEPYHTGYRWVMLALVSILYWVFGVLIRSPAPLVTPILEDLKISYSQMGFILASWPLTYILVAVGSGAILDRWGIRKSLFIGVVIIGLSEVLRYFATGFVSMVFCVALLGLGGPMISVGCPKTISMWFRGKGRGIAVGIYTSAVWIGTLTAYATANSVVMPLAGQSWRLAFVFYSLPAFAAALLWWFLARDITPGETSEQTNVVKVFTGLIGTRNVQIVLIMGFLSFAVAHGFHNWLPKILWGVVPENGGLCGFSPPRGRYSNSLGCTPFGRTPFTGKDRRPHGICNCHSCGNRNDDIGQDSHYRVGFIRDIRLSRYSPFDAHLDGTP